MIIHHMSLFIVIHHTEIRVLIKRTNKTDSNFELRARQTALTARF